MHISVVIQSFMLVYHTETFITPLMQLNELQDFVVSTAIFCVLNGIIHYAINYI